MGAINILIIAGCAFAILVLGKILLFPIKKLIRLFFNSIIGGVIIFVINKIGTIWGFHIGLNIFTAIFVGILGIPGAVLLIILKLILG